LSPLIRPARPAEAERLTNLARRAKASWGYPADWLQAWENDLTIAPQYVAEHQVFVAEADGDLVGVVALEVDGERAALEHVWVDPGHQRRGIGDALIRHALKAAAASGNKKIAVVSDPQARAFYERLGARQEGSIPAPMPRAPERRLPILHFLLDRA